MPPPNYRSRFVKKQSLSSKMGSSSTLKVKMYVLIKPSRYFCISYYVSQPKETVFSRSAYTP